LTIPELNPSPQEEPPGTGLGPPDEGFFVLFRSPDFRVGISGNPNPQGAKFRFQSRDELQLPQISHCLSGDNHD
jgi:hypothetical protein